MSINLKKCELIRKKGNPNPNEDIPGIKSVYKAKYLGMTISHSVKVISKEAKQSIKRNLIVLKGKIASNTMEVKE